MERLSRLGALVIVALGVPALSLADAGAPPARCGPYEVRLAAHDTPPAGARLRLLDGRGRTAWETRDRAINVTACEDITGDGTPELLVLSFSGGQRCCYTLRVLSMAAPVRELLRWNAGSAADLDVVTLGEVPRAKQLLGRDDRLANFGELPTVASPTLPALFCYDERSAYRDCTRDVIGREPLLAEWTDAADALDAERDLNRRRGGGTKLLAIAMLLGEEARAWRFLDERAADVVAWVRARREALARCLRSPIVPPASPARRRCR